jgi:adenylate cyclase
MSTISKKEIERKFLVDEDALASWLEDNMRPKVMLKDFTNIRQGYINTGTSNVTVRVRVENDTKSVLTIKTPTDSKITREEIETEIPIEKAEQLLVDPKVKCLSKKRLRIPFGGKVWELDVFEDENSQLKLVEVELESEDEDIEIPSWTTVEVSEDIRYSNAYLVNHPYNTWPKN